MIDIGSKHIHAQEIYNIARHPAWAIVNTHNGSEIACIAWYPSWKCYVMVTQGAAAFDTGCLESIIKFLKQKDGRQTESRLKDAKEVTGIYDVDGIDPVEYHQQEG